MEPVVSPRTFSNRYELTHLIARGGMAQVYLAHDRLLDRPVALKVLFPELSVDLAFVERFRREAQAAANLAHPNIVQVFDWGEDNGSYFIVMEYVEGRSLSAMLRQSPRLHPTEAAEIAAKVAAGLAYAHRRGVVHRDVKPGNILLTPAGEVKVTDFGIARAVNTEDSLTQVGSVMGTAAYFSPEQAEGLTVDARSDLYSLGVVLFEMLTGRTPFMGDSPVVVASKHVREQAPLARSINPSVPVPLEAIVSMAMAKAPSERYQSAEDFRADLLRFTEGQPVMAEAKLAAMADTGEVAATGALTGIVAGVAAGDPATASIPVGGRPYAVPPAKKKRPAWLVPVVLAVVAIVAIAAFLAGSGGGSSTKPIPQVSGLSVDQATTELLQAGFTVKGEKKVSSPTVTAGLVAGTDPAVGSERAPGTLVTLEISVGNEQQVTIPDLTGYTATAAQAKLSSLGLNPVIAYIPSPLPQNTVIGTDPAAGTKVWTTTKVTLNVPVIISPTVPAVVGMTPVNAGAALASAGLTVGTTTSACSNTVANGLVTAALPTPGTTVPTGSAVALTISTGVCQVVVPDVTGQDTATAIASLQSLGLAATTSAFGGDPTTCVANTIALMDTTAGSSVNYGSTINLEICPSSAG